MSELALQLIRENKQKQARGEDASLLDLGNCGLTEVPEEIGELVWLVTGLPRTRSLVAEFAAVLERRRRIEGR